jgi:rod shape-determining protein MreC
VNAFGLARISEAKDYILTALLLIFATVLLIGRNQGGIDNIRKVSITLFSYLEEPLSNIRVYRQALKTNTDLRKQNVLLLDELNRLRSAEQRNDELSELLQFSRTSNLTLYPIQIVGKELNQANNIFTIDGGSQDGIEEGMPVVSADGLIGKVVLTSSRFAQVMPFFNSLFRVSAKLQNSNAYGIVGWEGERITELELKYIPQTIAVDSGEVVVTSGNSNQYPPNIPIGEVIRTVPNKGKDTQRIYLRPFVNLYTIAEGFVVTTKPDTAVKKLNEQYRGLFK